MNEEMGKKCTITGVTILYAEKSKFIKKNIETNTMYIDGFKDFFRSQFKKDDDVPVIHIHYQLTLDL